MPYKSYGVIFHRTRDAKYAYDRMYEWYAKKSYHWYYPLDMKTYGFDPTQLDNFERIGRVIMINEKDRKLINHLVDIVKADDKKMGMPEILEIPTEDL